MAFTDGEPIYTGESRWLRIPDVEINGVPVTTAAPADSFVWTIKQAGTAVDTGNLTESATTAATWEAALNMPDDPGTTVFTALLTKDGTTIEFWRGVINLRSRD